MNPNKQHTILNIVPQNLNRMYSFLELNKILDLYISSQSQQMFFMISLITIFCLLLNSNFAFHWDYKITIIYCCIVQFTIMIQHILGSRKVNSQCCFSVVESVLIIAYLLAIVYNWEIQQININYISYSLLVLQFIILAITVLISRNSISEENQEQNRQIQDILISAIKSIGSLEIVFISLKWTNQISWNWIQTLIIIWFSLGTLLLIEVCLIIDLVLKCFQPPSQHQEQRKSMIFGSVWINLIVLSLCFIPFTTCMSAALFLDNAIYSLNLYAFIFSVTFYSIVVAYMKRNKCILENFLYLSDQNVESQESSNIQQEPQRQRQIKEKLKSFHRMSISKVPQFMARLSSTYYRVAEQSIKNNKKFRSKSLEVSLPIQKNQINEDNSKKFDQLLSSPRLKMECSESVAPDMTSRISQKQQNLCLVCYEKESNMINMPCGHGGFCQDCIEQLLMKSKLCVLCRKPVTHTLIVQNIKDRESMVEVIGMMRAEEQNG